MIDPKIAAMINAHLPFEAAAANAYLMMSLCSNQLGFFGCEKYFNQQSLEEREHLHKLIAFINDFDQSATVPAVDANPVEKYSDAGEIEGLFKQAQTMERTVTERIQAMRRAAMEANDEQSFEFLTWFVNEQTASEIELRDILARWRMSAGNAPEFDEYVQELING